MNRIVIFLTGLLFLSMISCADKEHGHVQTLPQIHSEFLRDRQVDVWTPNGYPQKDVAYATLYMHDGQMLFDASKTWNNQEWGLDECLQDLIDEEKIKPSIVVAVWNTEARFPEYAPRGPMKNLSDSAYTNVLLERAEFKEIKSDEYLSFLVKELKPNIEQHFQVSKNREDVFIAGSSMGGLISLYALIEYSETFGGAACLSTHWPLGMLEADPSFTLAYIAYMRERLPLPAPTKLYFDHGDQDLDALYPALQARVDSFFYNNDQWNMEFMSKAFPGHGHKEEYWQERLAIPMQFLLSK